MFLSEKYDLVKWDDENPKIWKIKVMFQTTNQMKLISKVHVVALVAGSM